MPVSRTKITEAYTVLGLEDGASLEVVKSTYKQLALRTHPDKNPGNEAATAEFQRLSEAYNALLKHLDRSAPPPRPGHYGAYDDESDYGDHDESDDGYWYYDSDYDDSEDDFYFESRSERFAFFMYMFEEVLHDRGNRSSQRSYHRHHHHEHVPPESQEEFQSRIRRAREEQELAAERRKREEARRKEEQERERARERKAAETRQKAKASNKKAQAEASRKSAESKAKALQERSQALRSAVFSAARSGDAQKVKKSVYEDHVDAAGGEVKRGCDAYMTTSPKDPSETLSHIAANYGDVDLLQWLDTHGADMEERNEAGYTPFHVALQRGYTTVLKYFFDMHEPDDSEAIYKAPPSKSLLTLAVESAQPEVVWMILDKKLASTKDMTDAWAYITSDGRKATLNKLGLAEPSDKAEEIVNLLATFGGFTKEADLEPEAELVTTPQSIGRVFTSSPPLLAGSGSPPPALSSQNGASPKKNYRNYNRKSAPPSTPSQASPIQLESLRPASASGQETPPKSAADNPTANTEHNDQPAPPRGRGRGYGRGRGRERGFKGRGRGGRPPPVSS